MSTLRCSCGHVISDTTDFLPYKAYFLPDRDTQGGSFDLTHQVPYVADLIETWQRGEPEPRPYPRSFTSVRDILQSAFVHPTFTLGRCIYECENCGRLFIQSAPGKNTYVSYLPESAARGILSHDGVSSDE